MTGFYQSLLRLYPRAHRQTFADEMLAVFLQADADASAGGPVARASFYFRELTGLLGGAIRERLCAFGEARGWKFLAEGGPVFQKERRYPYTSIAFMSLVLAITLVVIAKAQGIAQYLAQVTQYRIDRHLCSPAPCVVVETIPSWHFGNSVGQWPMHWGLISGIALGFVVAWAAGVAAWFVAHALRRSGAQRLDQLQTWPQPR